MRRLTFLTSMLVMAAVSSAAMSAQVVMPTVSTGMSKTNWMKTLSVAKFNTALGTLTGVDVTFNSGLTGTVKYENLNQEAQNIVLSVNGGVTLSWPAAGSPIAVENYAWNHTVTNAVADDGNFDWLSNGVDTSMTINDTTPAQTVSFNSGDANWSLFQGVGNVDFFAKSGFTSRTDSSGAVASWYATKALATVDVVYHYTLVPEPTGILALVTGLTGAIGMVLKRRKPATF